MAIIATALWLLSGSPPEINALIAIALFVAGSEILLWKVLFNLQKRSEVGFTKVKGDISLIRNDLSHMKNEINNKLDHLEKLIARRKK